MSPLQKAMYLSVQNERYLHAPPEHHDKAIRYPDIGRLQTIYEICRRASCRVLGAEYVIIDFLSGLQCMSICIEAFSKAGDLILSIDPANGGHEATRSIVEQLGRAASWLPFDPTAHVVNTIRLDPCLEPALVYFDHSNILHPHDVAAVKKCYPGATVMFDASQVMALVAGRQFPNPLNEGADVMIGTTHKSLNGPQKAIAATNSVRLHRQLRTQCMRFISNNHPSSIAALAVCFLEFEQFGASYAKQLVANANALSLALSNEGVAVYECRSPGGDDWRTHTQHVWIDCARMGWGAEDAVRELYSNGIVVNTLFLARGGPDGSGARGLRLGTTEVTRLGMRKEEMTSIAQAIASCLLGRNKRPSVRASIDGLRRRFRRVDYCYDYPDHRILMTASQEGTDGSEEE